MAGALTTQFAQGPRVTETLAAVVARIEPPAGFDDAQIIAASEQAAASVPTEFDQIPDIETRKYTLLKWAVTRRNELLKETRTHG